MKLSVVIVNYNVKYFLEQCLLSVKEASKGLDVEVFVVDNNSVDASVEMVKEKFPQVRLIENKENFGFSKANNQAIKISKGEYVLLLNPDTVVEDDTFRKVVDFMDNHPDAGGLGVKMIDGKGKFLPESKRGLPTPSVAFYKVFGLSKLFPKSKRFGKYHLGFLDKEKVHEIDVLSGAFMLLRKQALDKAGLLDETFFMYGEDIDLSYRVKKAGYKNYYYPATRIIHYKGESTKKGSINYVFVFYNAMVIFAKKHFSKRNANTFSFLINLAIYFRASLSLIKRFLHKIFLPLLDAAFIFGGLYFIKNYWERNIVGTGEGYYPNELLTIAFPSLIAIWLISVFFSGGYDKPIKLKKIFQGIAIGTVLILVIYALLSESYRFSRAIIILGAAWALIYMLGVRYLFNVLNIAGFKIESVKAKRFLIVGKKDEAERVANLTKQTGANYSFIGIVSSTVEPFESSIGTIEQIKEIVEIYKITEVIFCAKDMPAQLIIDKMSELQVLDVELKIAPPKSLYIIGSNSIESASDIYAFNVNSLNKPGNKRNKQLFDVLSSLFLLATYPITAFFVKRPGHFLLNIFKVMFAMKTWVGFSTYLENKSYNKKGVLNPSDALKNKNLNKDTINRLNLLYIRDYKIASDFNIMWQGFKQLGR